MPREATAPLPTPVACARPATREGGHGAPGGFLSLLARIQTQVSAPLASTALPDAPVTDGDLSSTAKPAATAVPLPDAPPRACVAPHPEAADGPPLSARGLPRSPHAERGPPPKIDPVALPPCTPPASAAAALPAPPPAAPVSAEATAAAALPAARMPACPKEAAPIAEPVAAARPPTATATARAGCAASPTAEPPRPGGQQAAPSAPAVPPARIARADAPPTKPVSPVVPPADREPRPTPAAAVAAASPANVPERPDPAAPSQPSSRAPSAAVSPAPGAPHGATVPALVEAAGLTAAPPLAAAAPVAVSRASAQASPVRQLIPALVHLARTQDGSRLTVQLAPAELGAVQVRIDRDAGGAVRVALTAERPETLHLLMRDTAQLNIALDAAGLSADRSISFHLAASPPHAAPAAAPPSVANSGAAMDQSAAGQGSSQDSPGQSRHRPGSRPTDSPPATALPSFDEAAAAPRWLRAGIDITA
jgi:hypothetical protein